MEYYTLLCKFCHENGYPEPKFNVDYYRVKNKELWKCNIMCIIDNTEYIGISNVCIDANNAIFEAFDNLLHKAEINMESNEMILTKNIETNNEKPIIVAEKNNYTYLKQPNINTKVRELQCINRDIIEVHKTLPTLYFMDLENIHMKYLPNPNSCYIGFIRDITYTRRYDNWYSLDRLEELHKIKSNKVLIKIKGDEKELCDHFITAYISYCINYLKNNNLPIVIVSKDKCAYAIAKCFKYILKFYNLTHSVKILNTL